MARLGQEIKLGPQAGESLHPSRLMVDTAEQLTRCLDLLQRSVNLRVDEVLQEGLIANRYPTGYDAEATAICIKRGIDTIQAPNLKEGCVLRVAGQAGEIPGWVPRMQGTLADI